MISTTDPTRPNRSRNRWFAVGALSIAAVAFLIITVSGIGENLVYYWSPSDLRAAGRKAIGATIRLGGQVRPGSVVGGQTGAALEFDVVDGKSSVHVKSSGVPPQLFREGIGVVVEGTMTSQGHFTSERLMVSHDNEYQAPKKGQPVNARELIRSTEGLTEEGIKVAR